MQIDIQSQPFSMTRALAQFVTRRLKTSLQPRAGQINAITVRLSDINGPRGGADKRCRLRIRLSQSRDVVIEETRNDMYAAVSRATARAKRVVERRLRRSRDRGLRKLQPSALEPEAS